jgi:hypothetical protein
LRGDLVDNHQSSQFVLDGFVLTDHAKIVVEAIIDLVLVGKQVIEQLAQMATLAHPRTDFRIGTDAAL